MTYKTSETKAEKTGVGEMLSFGGVQFATGMYMAFSSFYLMTFCTDVALIPSAITAVLLFFFPLLGVIDIQAVGLFINRMQFKDGKYRPYMKWCALPFAASLAALGLAPGVSGVAGRVAYLVFILVLCDLSRTTLYTASISMIPYLARDDESRTKIISFSNGGAILAYIAVGTLMTPLAKFFGGGAISKGYATTLALFAAVAAPLIFIAYFRLKEGLYSAPKGGKPPIREIYPAIARNKRIMLFLAGFCLYSMADAFKNQTAYFYVTHVMGRPDLVPGIIFAGLISPLAFQPVIPRLLKYARKETLIAFGLFAASCSGFLMLAIGSRPVGLIVCVVLYGVFTAIVANLVYAVVASFTDEVRARQNFSVSEILTSSLNLSSNVGIAISGGTAALVMAAFGYSALAEVQTSGALFAIKLLYIVFTAVGLVCAGVVMTLFRKNAVIPAKNTP